MKKSVCGMLILVAVICASIMICFGQTFANSMLSEEDLQSYSLNDIMFYDPCSGGFSGGSGGACGITVSGSTMEEKVWSGLTTFMTEEQAAGVMGNMETESAHTFSPAVHENAFFTKSRFANFDVSTDTSSSYGIGLIQWSWERRVNLYNAFKENGATELWDKYIDKERRTYGDSKLGGDGFLKKAGDDVANRMIAIELCFLKGEIETSYKELYDKKTPEEAAYYFLVSVERPQNPAASKDAREKAAKKFYDQFHGKSITGSSSSGGSASCGGGNVKDSKNINATAVALSWPEGTDPKEYMWIQANGLVLREAYNSWKNGGSGNTWKSGAPTEAFKEALESVKDGSLPGNPCSTRGAACDVFAGTVVRYSGYDKKFPFALGKVLDYVRSKDDLWEVLPFEKSKLQAGDLMIKNSGHIAIAVRDENNELWIAQGSLCYKFGYISKDASDGYQHIVRAKKANNSTAGVSVKDGVANSNSSGTVTKAGTGNGDIGASAFELALPLEDLDKAGSEPTKKFANYYKKVKTDNAENGGKSCDCFAGTVVRYAGLDDEFPICGGVASMEDYVEGNDDWERIEVSDPTKLNDYKSGDLVFYYKSGHENPGHVGIYAEDSSGKPFDVSASQGDRYGSVRESSYITNMTFHTGKRVIFRNKNNNNATVECDVCAGESDEGNSSSNGGAVSGGLSLAKAENFMKIYHDLPSSQWEKYSLTGYGCTDGPVANCVSFSNYFVIKYTSYGRAVGGDGGVFARNFASAAKLKSGNEPKPYAVFSRPEGVTMCGGHLCGHTGVVLGIDKKNNKIIIGEAGCSKSNAWTGAHEYDLSAWTGGNVFYAYTDNIVNLGAIANDAE